MNKNKLKVFLDDERDPVTHKSYLSSFGVDSFDDYSGFTIVRNFKEFTELIKEKGLPSKISFDHDLGGLWGGFDCVEWLIDYHLDNNLNWNIECKYHTANPIGKENMKSLIENFKRFCI